MKPNYNVGDVAFEVNFLMSVVEEGKTVYPHICAAVVSNLKDFCEDVLKNEFHEEIQLDGYSHPVLSLDDLKKVRVFLREKGSSLSYHTTIEAKKYNIVAVFLSDVIEFVGELDAVKVEKMLDEESDRNFYRNLAKDISVMIGKRQPDDIDERIGTAVEKISGGVFREDAKKAIELLKKGEGKITGVGSSIENLVCSEIERNLEYF